MSLSKKIQSFIVSDKQMAIDKKMVGFDIWGTMAHVLMLHKTKIIDKEKANGILNALFEIQKEYEKGNFEIDPKKGSQLTLEAKIIEKAGEDAGLSTHTARSRNDQIMVTEMMYVREEILKVVDKVINVVGPLVKLAKENTETVMPGYTHMQPAKPTTFGQWCMFHANSLIKGMGNLKFVLEKYDLNPLGAAESYGTSWPIDKNLTTKLLGFKKAWQIPQEAISSRGFFQVEMLHAFNMIAIATNKLASDLMLFVSFEYGMVSLGEEVAKRLHPITGSSIMAQKKNPDAVELIRGTAPQLAGIYQAALGVLTGLPSGYNRDGREIKEYTSLGLEKTNTALDALEKVVSTMKPNKKRMLDLVNQNYSMTTDLADFISQKTGTPYRAVYKAVGKAVDKAINENKLLSDLTPKDLGFDISEKDLDQALDPVKAVSKRSNVAVPTKELEDIKNWAKEKDKHIEKARKLTIDSAKKIDHLLHL